MCDTSGEASLTELKRRGGSQVNKAAILSHRSALPKIVFFAVMFRWRGWGEGDLVRRGAD